MAITLNHTIVPAHDHEASARFFAKIFGLTYAGPAGHFAPVVVNDTLTMDFDNREGFEGHHYAFRVSEEDFDDIFGRIKAEAIPYGSGPRSQDDMDINHRKWRTGRLLERRRWPRPGDADSSVKRQHRRLKAIKARHSYKLWRALHVGGNVSIVN